MEAMGLSATARVDMRGVSKAIVGMITLSGTTARGKEKGILSTKLTTAYTGPRNEHSGPLMGQQHSSYLTRIR